MEYTRSIGDIYETFEGTPDEIVELMMRMPEKIEFETGETIDEEEMIEDIYCRLFPYNVPKDIIKQVLDAEMKYLEKKKAE